VRRPDRLGPVPGEVAEVYRRNDEEVVRTATAHERLVAVVDPVLVSAPTGRPRSRCSTSTARSAASPASAPTSPTR
jgi:hypothetical protein